MAKKTITPVNQNSDAYIKLRIKDHEGVILSSVTSITMSLHNQDDDSIINARSGTVVTSSFDYTLAPDYNFKLLLIPADNPIVGTNDSEVHIMTLTVTYLSGSDTLTLNETVWIKVAKNEYL